MYFNDFIEKEFVEKEFDTPIGKIIISRERNIYNQLFKKYKVLAKDSLKSFKECYSTYKNCYDVLKKGPDDFYKSVLNIVGDIKGSLINMGQYDCDDDIIYKFAEELECFKSFDDVIDAIAGQVSAITDDVELQRQYRQQRKDNRARWEGATFGGNAINAISHQMDVSAMNLASGAAHSVANAAGNFLSELAAESDLEDLFEESKESLFDAVYSSAVLMALIEMKVLGSSFDWGVVDSADSDKAQRLMNNIKSGSISESSIPEICHQILDLDPFNSEVYEYILEKYGDDGRLNTLAEYFEISELTDKKDQMALEYVKRNQGETEEDAIKAKELLIEYCKTIKLEVSEELECIEYINDLIADFDLKYRTVDNIECTTREAADFAREELPKITEFMKDITPPSADPLLPYERNLLAKREEFEGLYSSEIAKKYLNTINSYLDQFEKEFCNTKLFSSVSRQQAARDRALRYAKGLKYATIEEYEESYNKLAAFVEPNLGVTLDEAVEAKQYLEKKKAKLERGNTIDMANISNGLNELGGTLKGLFGRKK